MANEYKDLTFHSNFGFPEEFRKVVNLELTNLEPWYILDPKQLADKMKGLRERYPSKELIPFARRTDNDDVACFEVGNEQKVFVIHDFASPGWEQHEVYETFWDWFRQAIEEMINF